MQEMILERVRALLGEGAADRVLGWEAGESFYDRTPAFFTADNLDQLKYDSFCGCHPGDCHYSTGNYYARRRMTLLFSMLDYLGIERGRTRVEWVSAAEGAKFAATMNDFAKTITELGENKKLGDLRCKK